LTTPRDELLYLSLGGSDEIGMNVNLYGCQGQWIMVDLGITFANNEYPGCDIVLPDLRFIEARRKNLLGIVLTHGHEDHIGALPYLAADLKVPLYATKFTAALIRAKLEEEDLAREVELNIIEEGGQFQLGCFGLTYVPLAHSILEMNALIIDTPHGRVFHTGDWKLDDAPVLGKPSSMESLNAIGDSGVLAMVCDSTNVFNEAASGSEGALEAGLMQSVKAAKGRVLVTSFASNAARLKTLALVAIKCKRKLCVAGRSLERILELAQASGYLRDFPRLVDFNEAMRLPPNQVMIIATGGQGESRAALYRIAHDTHPLKLDKGDTVIFSSRQIPGNEVAIGRIQNMLARKDIFMVTEKQAHIHVSGHPSRPELAAMYDWIRPQMLIPVHGERRHMAEHARFARAQGIAQTIVQSNGDVVRLAPDGPKIIGKEATGRLVLDGDMMVPAQGETLTQRRKLSEMGIIHVALAVSSNGMKGSASVCAYGVPLEEDMGAFTQEAQAKLLDIARKGHANDLPKLAEKIRLAVRRLAQEFCGKKPLVHVHLVEI
jgi:ribonuclease J